MDAVVEGTFVSDPLGQGPPAETLLPTFVDARPRSIVVAVLGDVSLPSHLAIPNRPQRFPSALIKTYDHDPATDCLPPSEAAASFFDPFDPSPPLTT
ncbi:hypothetical protein FOXYSP1_16951 [Fusarium oxysporum f. sp. phaseoli]